MLKVIVFLKLAVTIILKQVKNFFAISFTKFNTKTPCSKTNKLLKNTNKLNICAQQPDHSKIPNF